MNLCPFAIAGLLLPASLAIPLGSSSISVAHSATYTAGSFSVNGSDSPFLQLQMDGPPGDYYNWYLRASDGLFCVTDADFNDVVEWSTREKPGNCYTPNTCELTFESDGNLVYYYNGAAVWRTNTSGLGATLTLETVYIFANILDSSGNVVWQSNLPPQSPSPGNPCGCGSSWGPAPSSEGGPSGFCGPGGGSS